MTSPFSLDLRLNFLPGKVWVAKPNHARTCKLHLLRHLHWSCRGSELCRGICIECSTRREERCCEATGVMLKKNSWTEYLYIITHKILQTLGSEDYWLQEIPVVFIRVMDYKGVAMSMTGLFWNAKLHIKQCFPPQRYSSSRPWRNLRCSKAGFRVVNGFFLIIDATTFLSHALLLCLFFCPCRAQCSGTGCAVLSKDAMSYEINSICNVHKNDRTGASERWIQNRFECIFWWDMVSSDPCGVLRRQTTRTCDHCLTLHLCIFMPANNPNYRLDKVAHIWWSHCNSFSRLHPQCRAAPLGSLWYPQIPSFFSFFSTDGYVPEATAGATRAGARAGGLLNSSWHC